MNRPSVAVIASACAVVGALTACACDRGDPIICCRTPSVYIRAPASLCAGDEIVAGDRCDAVCCEVGGASVSLTRGDCADRSGVVATSCVDSGAADAGGGTISCADWCTAVTTRCMDDLCMQSCVDAAPSAPTRAAVMCVTAAGADCAAVTRCWSTWR